MRDSTIVCFVGVDGSGKSTLSRSLYEELRKQKYDVTYTWWLEAESSVFRKGIRGLFNTSGENLNKLAHEPSPRNRSSLANGLLKLYPWAVILDYLGFGIMKTRIPCRRGSKRILLFDRYYFDTIFALCQEFDIPDNTRESLVKIFRIFVPDPDILYVIDVPPEISHSRKPEEILSIQNARALWENQQNVNNFIISKLENTQIFRMDNSGDLDRMEKRILLHTLKYLRS